MPKITIIDGVNEIELSTAPKENIKAYMVKGESGSDGVSPTASVSKTGGTTTITVTDKNGTTEEDVKDGFNPTVTTSRNGNVTTVTITDINGTRTTDIADGIDMTGGVPTDGVIGWVKNELIYTCDGTESGDYYLTYDSNDYYFTMPTVEEGDILVFSIDDLELSLDGTTITTASTGTGTELTFLENIPNGYEVSPESIATLTNSYSDSTEEGYSCKYFNDNVPTVNDIYSASTTDTYNCDYINNLVKPTQYTNYSNGYNLTVNSYKAYKFGELVNLYINLSNNTGSTVPYGLFGIPIEIAPDETMYIPIVRSGSTSYCSIQTSGAIYLSSDFANLESMTISVTYVKTATNQSNRSIEGSIENVNEYVNHEER